MLAVADVQIALCATHYMLVSRAIRSLARDHRGALRPKRLLGN